jgi:type I restriction enzyme R subunit
MPHAYTEDQLVERPAIGLFAELGWAVAGSPPNAGVAGEPRDAGLLGRETKGEVVLVSRLRAAQSSRPNPQPLPFSHWEKGGRQAGLRVRSLLPPRSHNRRRG